jgi:hypothetical protein
MLEIGEALFPNEWTGNESEEWEATRYASKTRVNDAAALERFERVCCQVASACQSGALVYGLRPREGGKVLQAPPKWWNTEGAPLLHRFSMFSLNTSRPFQSGMSERQNEDWICISRDSLAKFLSRFKSSHTSVAKDESDAIAFLTSRLKQDPNLKKADAKAECAKFGISQRGFRDRVWPKARESAGLPTKAPPGRK